MKINKRIRNTMMVTIIGATIVVSATVINSTSEHIRQLELENKQKTTEINNLSLINDDLMFENKNLCDKNTKLENKIKDLSFKKVSFNPDDVTQPSHLGSKQLEIVFNTNTRYSSLKGLEQAFIDAENKYGVNAIFILGIVSQESLYGTSDRAINDFNLAGIECYSSSSEGKLYNSKEECIMHMAEFISRDYLNGGKYYKGKDIYSINSTYCITPDEGKYSWSNNIIKITNKYIDEINKL